MKRLRNNQEVAHFFANKVCESGQGSSFYFTNDYDNKSTLYSYGRHFAIAKFDRDTEGNQVLLFTERTYGQATSRHIQYARSATSHLLRVFVPSLENTPIQNIEYYRGQAKFILEKLLSARKPVKYLDMLERLKAKVTAYCKFLGIPIPEDLSILLNVTDSDGVPESIRLSTEAEKERLLQQKREFAIYEAKRAKEEAERVEETLIKWRNFEVNSIYSSWSDAFSYLRFNADKGRVETSQRVEIPVNIALDFYYIINSIKRIDVNKRDLGTSGVRLLGMYQLNEVGEDFIRVGCHKISFAEIEAIIPVLLAFVNSQAKTA